MATYLPPSDNLPIFDSSVFDETNSAYLTYTSAKKLFLTYPTAQGEETIASLITAEIDTSTPTSAFNFLQSQTTGDILIGNSLTASGGATIKIGPTGASGNVSVHCSNIDFYNNTINNATSATLNNLSIGGSQTEGVLNLGTGTRITSGNGGAINMGTGASSTAPINIGGGASASSSINIGQTGTTTGTTTTNINTSTVGSHPVNIGSSTALTTINGASTLTGAVTATTGISTPYVEPTSASTALALGATQTTGILNIGSGSRSGAGAINIGSSASNSAPINLGGVNSAANTVSSTSTSTVSLNGSRLWSNWVSEASIRTGGTLTLTSSNSATVNIATESFSDIIVGASGTTKTMLIYNILNSIFSNDVGGGALTSTTLSLAGKLRHVVVLSSSTSYTLSSNLNLESFVIIQNGASGTIFLPTSVTLGQKITFRNLSVNAITLNTSSNNIIPPNSTVSATTTSLAAYATVSYYVYTTTPLIWLSV
jgi:hypothetical protein